MYKVKQQFMAYLQQQFNDPTFSFPATKHTAQWQNTTTQMAMKIMKEMKMETTMKTILLDQDPMV